MLKRAAVLSLLLVVVSPGVVRAQTAEQKTIAQATALFKAGKPKQAESVLTAALKTHPDSEALHASLGRLLFKRQRYEEAVQQLGTALQINPDSRENTMLLAEALIGWQHFGVAVDFLHAVEDKFGNTPEFHYDLGLAYYSENKLREARPEFEETVRLAPNLDRAQYLLAACIASEGDFPKAVDIFRQLVKDHPKNSTYWITYAQMVARLGNDSLPEALRACRRATALKPHDPHVQYVTATTLLQSGNYAEARPLFEHLVTLDPKGLASHVALARIYAHLGERDLLKKETQIVSQIESDKAAQSSPAPSPPPVPAEENPQPQ